MTNQAGNAWQARVDNELGRLAFTLRDVLNATRGNESAIDSVHRELGQRFSGLVNAQAQTDAKIEELGTAFAKFVAQDRRDKERLIAHTSLIDIRAQIERRFGQYSDVRRNVHGMLLALDGGLTQDGTMQLIAETQSINAPDYWLASAQNALAAWIRDDPGAAERALIHATTCSRGKTGLFFGLLNARYGRFGATEQWFREYLKNQSPQKLSLEFTVVLDAAMLG